MYRGSEFAPSTKRFNESGGFYTTGNIELAKNHGLLKSSKNTESSVFKIDTADVKKVYLIDQKPSKKFTKLLDKEIKELQKQYKGYDKMPVGKGNYVRFKTTPKSEKIKDLELEQSIKHLTNLKNPQLGKYGNEKSYTTNLLGTSQNIVAKVLRKYNYDAVATSKTISDPNYLKNNLSEVVFLKTPKYKKLNSNELLDLIESLEKNRLNINVGGEVTTLDLEILKLGL